MDGVPASAYTAKQNAGKQKKKKLRILDPTPDLIF